jgi:pimeloyl-ACP methyl ester carboxylesterase
VDPLPTVAKLAEDLAFLMENERLSDVWLVGHSMGAFVALEYLARYGSGAVSALAMVDMTLLVPCTQDWELGLYGKWQRADIEKFLTLLRLDFVKGMAYYASHGLYGLYQSFFPQLIEDGLLNPEAVIFLYEDLLTKDYRDFYSTLGLPILLLYGGKSQVYPRKLGERLREMNSNARLKVFNEGTHLLFLEEPEGFVNFLKEMKG